MNQSTQSKVKVFIDCRWYAQSGQGVVTFIDGLHRAAEQLLATPEYSGHHFEFWYGVESLATTPGHLFLPRDRVIEMGRRGLFWRLLKMPYFLRQHGFTAAHFSYMCPFIRNGVVYITTVHDVLCLRHPRFFSFPHRLSRKILFGLSARRSEIVLTVSDQSRVDIVELLGRKGPVSLVPCAPGHASEASTISPEPVEGIESGRYFLAVGRVEPRKNYPTLVRAFHRSGLASNGAQLVLVGFCSDEFASERPHLLNQPGVRWLTGISDAELKWLYANAKAFVFPSHCEGFGIPVVEAMRAGLPIGVSDTYPLADVLAAAQERFDPRSEEQMAVALTKLWSTTLQPKDVAPVLARYTWQNAARAYLAALAPLLSDVPSQGATA